MAFQHGQLDKLSPELKDDIRKYLHDRSIKQVDLMKKHGHKMVMSGKKMVQLAGRLLLIQDVIIQQ